MALLGATAAPPVLVAVLTRVRRDLLAGGALQPGTAAAMYTLYTAHAAATTVALVRDAGQLPIPRPVRWAGAALTVSGTGLCLAGMSRFSGLAQLNGTDPDVVVTSGAYRFSRNPQYLGYIVAQAGFAVARRSPGALALATITAAVYRWWVVAVEERHLERHFGADYRAFLARTPRWIGLPPCTARPQRGRSWTSPRPGGRRRHQRLRLPSAARTTGRRE